MRRASQNLFHRIFAGHLCRATRLLCGLLSCLTLTAWAQPQPQENGPWYLQGSIHQIAGSTSPVTLNMGGPVILDGQQNIGSGTGLSVTLGKQFASRKDDGTTSNAWRVEIEALRATLRRTDASVGTLVFSTDDSIRVNALFLNAAYQLTQSAALYGATRSSIWRTWLGAGIGIAETDIAKANNTPAGCNCFNPVKSSGPAYQVKLAVERQISSDNWFMYGQLARIWLPSASTPSATLPQTLYGKLSGNTISFGVLKLF
jgi:hypothetical protein